MAFVVICTLTLLRIKNKCQIDQNKQNYIIEDIEDSLQISGLERNSNRFLGEFYNYFYTQMNCYEVQGP